jgi:hypothetical protein
MLRIRTPLVAVLLAAALSAGCASESERPENNVPPPRRQAPTSDPLPAGFTPLPTVAPVSRWRRDLQEVVPAGWTLGEAQDQIDAPLGWERRGGDRGLRFDISDARGSTRFVVTLMPAGFEGRSDELGLVFVESRTKPFNKPLATGAPTEEHLGAAGDFYLFVKNDCGSDWVKATDDVARALGAKKP